MGKFKVTQAQTCVNCKWGHNKSRFNQANQKPKYYCDRTKKSNLPSHTCKLWKGTLEES